MADRTLTRSIGQLALALLNATLILAALCLWLARGMLSTAERVSENLTEAAHTVAPLRADAIGLTGEIATLRDGGPTAAQ